MSNYVSLKTQQFLEPSKTKVNHCSFLITGIGLSLQVICVFELALLP